MNTGFRALASIVSLTLLVATANAQRANNDEADDAANQQITRQAQAVSRSVYEVIEKAQRLVEEEDFDGAIKLLTGLVDKDNLTEYEYANVYQYLGFCLHSKDDTAAALEVFAKILAIEGLEPQMRKRTLYTVAQLHTVEVQYDQALNRMEQWFDLEPNPASSALIFQAQIYYQLSRFEAMIAPIEEALAIAEKRGLEAKEEWYSLLSFAYFQKEDFAKIRDINKVLLVGWPKKRYWLYLANAYRELGDDDSLVAAYQLAYEQGMLDSEAELVTMAQLYLQREVPLKAAHLIEAEMESGRIEKTAKNYRLLSQAWSLAREDERSIEPLTNAAGLDDDGELYIRLANTYLNLGEHEKCVVAAKAGLGKGGLRNPDYANISLGMCYYNLHEYVASIRAFRLAEEAPRSEPTARQWIRIATLDIQRMKEIEKAEVLASKRFADLEERKRANERS
jgi:hypothetical protein